MRSANLVFFFFFIEMFFCWDERKIIIPMLDKNKIVR